MRSAPVKRSQYTVSAPNARDLILIPIHCFFFSLSLCAGGVVYMFFSLFK